MNSPQTTPQDQPSSEPGQIAATSHNILTSFEELDPQKSQTELRFAGARACEVGGDVERKAGLPAYDGIEAPAAGDGLGGACEGVVEGQIPAAGEDDTVADIEIGDGVEEVGVVVGDAGVPLAEAGDIVHVFRVRVGELEIGGTGETELRGLLAQAAWRLL